MNFKSLPDSSCLRCDTSHDEVRAEVMEVSVRNGFIWFVDNNSVRANSLAVLAVQRPGVAVWSEWPGFLNSMYSTHILTMQFISTLF